MLLKSFDIELTVIDIKSSEMTPVRDMTLMEVLKSKSVEPLVLTGIPMGLPVFQHS